MSRKTVGFLALGLLCASFYLFLARSRDVKPAVEDARPEVTYSAGAKAAEKPESSTMFDNIEKKNEATSNGRSIEENQAILNRPDGRQEVINLGSKDDAKKLILSHENQNPADEFSAMRPINFKGDADGTFANTYSDLDHSFEFMFRYSSSDHSLNQYSCLYSKESGSLPLRGETLDVRSDGNGYAMVRLGENMYLRMTHFMGEQDQAGRSRPIIYAKVFSKIELDWKVTRELQAHTVTEAMMPNRYCK